MQGNQGHMQRGMQGMLPAAPSQGIPPPGPGNTGFQSNTNYGSRW